ncbi:MAG TPA: hypothetical protein VN366_08450 [Feifaniaceae bacterium]|nr:hypothetical protein [Feifaniaceae bacterium]
MKRIVALLCLLLPLALWGCSSAEAGPEGVVTKGVQPVTEDAGTAVYGRVESIVGNEVVLALGKPQVSTASSLETPEGQAAQGRAQEGRQIEIGEAPEGDASGSGPSFSTGGRSGGGETFTSGGPQGSGRAPSGEANAPFIQPSGDAGTVRGASLEYTGETATYLLPVGMAIGSGDFSSVSEGMVLALSLNGEGAITAVRVLG